MLAFSIHKITFSPPLSIEKNFYISLRTSDGQHKVTKQFPYDIRLAEGCVKETLTCKVNQPDKVSYFKLKLYEVDRIKGENRNIAEEIVYLSKFYSNHSQEIVMPTLFGMNALVSLTVEVTNGNREILLQDEKETKKGLQLEGLPLDDLCNLDNLSVSKFKALYQVIIWGITPIVIARDAILDFLTWKNPYQTFTMSAAVSIFILFPRFFIMMGVLAVMLFGRRLFPLIFALKPLENKTESRTTTGKRNIIFIKDFAKFFAWIYDVYRRIFEDPEKKLLSKIFIAIRRFSPFVLPALYFIKLRILVLMAYWTFLFYNTKIGYKFITMKYLQTSMLIDEWTTKPLTVRRVKNVVHNVIHHKTDKYGSLDNLDADYSTEDTKTSLTDASTPPKKNAAPKEKIYVIYENQRWWVGSGWSEDLLPGERPSWSDVKGTIELKKDDVRLPGSEWKWEGDWCYTISQDTDKDGWEYASRFSKFDKLVKKKSMIQSVRRRKWIRRCVEAAE